MKGPRFGLRQPRRLHWPRGFLGMPNRSTRRSAGPKQPVFKGGPKKFGLSVRVDEQYNRMLVQLTGRESLNTSKTAVMQKAIELLYEQEHGPYVAR